MAPLIRLTEYHRKDEVSSRPEYSLNPHVFVNPYSITLVEYAGDYDLEGEKNWVLVAQTTAVRISGYKCGGVSVVETVEQVLELRAWAMDPQTMHLPFITIKDLPEISTARMRAAAVTPTDESQPQTEK